MLNNVYSWFDSRFNLERFGSWTSIFSFFITLISSLIVIASFFTNEAEMPQLLENALNLAPYVAFVFLTILALGLFNRYRDLRKLVHDGIEYTYDKVVVNVDVENKLYKFIFEKHFTIISKNCPHWFKRQFYCNKYLGDNEASRKYYDENPPTWESLNVFADLKYQNKRESNFSHPVPLEIIPITDNSYYIPFHINYIEAGTADDGVLPLKVGSKVILKYGYQVSAELWGSYLNRSLSYFGEEAIVEFVYSRSKAPIEIDLRLAELSSPDGIPTTIEKNWTPDYHGDDVVYTFIIPRKSNGRFRIWWDSQKLLGTPSTDNVPDASRLTDY